MTLIELLEHCIWILSDGRNLEDCRKHLVEAGVHREVINAIINTLNEDGTYKRTTLTESINNGPDKIGSVMVSDQDVYNQQQKQKQKESKEALIVCLGLYGMIVILLVFHVFMAWFVIFL